MKRLITSTAIACFTMLPVSGAFAHGTSQDTVVNEGGSVVVGTYGSCVRSKWDAGMDPCAPPPAPEPAPVVKKPAVEPERDARTVYFDFNKSELSPVAMKKLDDLVRWLSTAKGVTSATVYGYADQIGNADYNQALSNKRAASVETYLASKGVVLPTNVEIVKGLGETDSLTSCADSLPKAELIKCLAADRRVEIKFEILR